MDSEAIEVSSKDQEVEDKEVIQEVEDEEVIVDENKDEGSQQSESSQNSPVISIFNCLLNYQSQRRTTD